VKYDIWFPDDTGFNFCDESEKIYAVLGKPYFEDFQKIGNDQVAISSWPNFIVVEFLRNKCYRVLSSGKEFARSKIYGISLGDDIRKWQKIYSDADWDEPRWRDNFGFDDIPKTLLYRMNYKGIKFSIDVYPDDFTIESFVIEKIDKDCRK